MVKGIPVGASIPRLRHHQQLLKTTDTELAFSETRLLLAAVSYLLLVLVERVARAHRHGFSFASQAINPRYYERHRGRSAIDTSRSTIHASRIPYPTLNGLNLLLETLSPTALGCSSRDLLVGRAQGFRRVRVRAFVESLPISVVCRNAKASRKQSPHARLALNREDLRLVCVYMYYYRKQSVRPVANVWVFSRCLGSEPLLACHSVGLADTGASPTKWSKLAAPIRYSECGRSSTRQTGHGKTLSTNRCLRVSGLGYGIPARTLQISLGSGQEHNGRK
ncbi:hypothetical protein EDB83DRAFT_1857357 [Lactarius deliciosus]|nr:hypothetical protein EDB83DRAFT_1857357 [Lactarius deliciosus]